MKLRTKLNFGIVLAFLILALCMSVITLYWSKNATIKQAGERVERSINSAWLIYSSKLERIHLLAESQTTTIAKDFEGRASNALVDELTTFRQKNNLDIVNLLDSQGKVITRSRKPDIKGDSLVDNMMVKKTLATRKAVTGTVMFHPEQLEREGKDLVERCEKYGGEPAGMFMLTTVPVIRENELKGLLMVGALLNGSVDKVDKIRNLVFEGRRYKGKPVGTATIFMEDLRISTNVVDEKGKRAIGTRVSTDVADRVLSRGQSWTGRARVLDAWYISQYDPIRNPNDEIVGMLYLGELEQKYLDAASRELIVQLAVILTVMILMLAIIFIITGNILRPIGKLSSGTQKLTAGDLTSRVEVKTGDEVGRLCESFNHMAGQLQKHRSEIEKRQKALEEINVELKTTNKNYMEMLGFVSHELKNPLASAIMGLFTVKDGYIGELNSGQKKSLDSVAKSLNYFKDMIENYLDLSRLEKGELHAQKSQFRVLEEVVEPVLESLKEQLRQKKMVIENHIPANAELNADKNLLRIVYDNLLSNAVKYGEENGRIELNYTQDGREVVLNVRNEGKGIPKEKMSMLFKKFSRIDSPEYVGKKGTGLGLFICKEIIEKQGGKIWAESEQDRWVTFSFTLPKQGDIA